jgi:hypothetical protein
MAYDVTKDSMLEMLDTGMEVSVTKECLYSHSQMPIIIDKMMDLGLVNVVVKEKVITLSKGPNFKPGILHETAVRLSKGE